MTGAALALDPLVVAWLDAVGALPVTVIMCSAALDLLRELVPGSLVRLLFGFLPFPARALRLEVMLGCPESTSIAALRAARRALSIELEGLLLVSTCRRRHVSSCSVRATWFVVGLPVFYAAGWRFVEVGGFLASWTIAYGGVQAFAPRLVARSADGPSRKVPNARLWAGLLVALLALVVLLDRRALGGPTWCWSWALRCSPCRSPSIRRSTPT